MGKHIKVLLFYTSVLLTTAVCSPTNVTVGSADASNQLQDEIISETDIFYRPGSNDNVPLISQPEDSTKDRGPKGVYGWLPCFCDYEKCSCCVDIRIKALNSNDNGCITLSQSNYDNSSVLTGVTWNNRTLVERRVSFDDPSPLCSPSPRFPFVSGCIKFYRLRTDNAHIKGCTKMELRLTGTNVILWDMKFSCFKIGFDGVALMNTNKDKVKPNTELTRSLHA